MLATKAGRPRLHPVAHIRIWLCGCKQTEPLKAVTFDGGRSWEVIERDPVFRGCVLNHNDVEVVSDATTTDSKYKLGRVYVS